MIDRLPGDIFRQGQVLNHTYEIEGVLGRGGTGEVYRARNQISGRIVAIKALNSQFSGNNEYIDLMRREEQMRDVMNDAVVRYTECSRTDLGHVFLVMDFIDGPSMNDVMMRRRMDARELMIIAHRVAEGLVVAHARGIVHRDLSPDNIVLRDGAPEKAVIIDFGIAKDTAAGAKSIIGNGFAGKYEYAAPEQLEGRAEKRSDLYALGATLLAAYRGQIPFDGSTPGEIIRRKQNRLDTEGVSEPLKGLIDWLSAPALAERPLSAEAVVVRLNDALKPTSVRGKKQFGGRTETSGPRRRVGGLVLAGLLFGLGGGAWVAGVFDPLFEPVLPIATPYLLTASLDPDGTARLSGNAPTPEMAQALQQAFAAVTGSPPPPDTLVLAKGVPSETWGAEVAAGLGLMSGLDDWSFSVSDTTATVAGVASSGDYVDTKRRTLRDWASQSGLKVTVDLAVGPRMLAVAAVQASVDPLADCGPLTQSEPPETAYAFGDTIAISGAVSSKDTQTKLQLALEGTAGDRVVRIDTQVLNADLCKVRNVLPPLASDDLSLWFGDGETGDVNLSGIYHSGENPVVEVLTPADKTGYSLWVVTVDNTGQVFNILPNIKSPKHDIQSVGKIIDAQRRIRVLFTQEDLDAKLGFVGFMVSPENFGKSEIIAILSRKPLFEVRPTVESVASFVEALESAQKEDPGNIVSIASRVLDARP